MTLYFVKLFFLLTWGSPQIIDHFLNLTTPEKKLKEISTYTHYNPTKKIFYWQSAGHKEKKKIRHIGRTLDEILFDVTYLHDNYFRRVTQLNERATKHLIIHGGSNAYGLGLADHQTLPYHLSKKMNKTMVYNYAIPGTGPNTTLEDIQDRNLNKEITQQDGDFLFIYIDHHIARANGFMQELQWLADSPFFKKENGKMINQGPFKEASPIRTWFLNFLHNKIKIHKLFNKNYPVLRQGHIDYTCDIFEALKQSYQNQFRKGVFRILIHPLSTMNQRLEKCLTGRNIEVISFGDQYSSQYATYSIKYDQHPNEKMNKLLAQNLINILKLD